MSAFKLPQWDNVDITTMRSYLQKLIRDEKYTFINLSYLSFPEKSDIIKNNQSDTHELFIQRNWPNTKWNDIILHLDNTIISKCSNLSQYLVVQDINHVVDLNIYYIPMKIVNGGSIQFFYVSLVDQALVHNLGLQYNRRNALKIDDKLKALTNVNKQNAVTYANTLYLQLIESLKSCDFKAPASQSAGSKKPKYTRTNDPKVKTPKGMRCVYVGSRGAKYVKLGGVFVNIKKLYV